MRPFAGIASAALIARDRQRRRAVVCESALQARFTVSASVACRAVSARPAPVVSLNVAARLGG